MKIELENKLLEINNILKNKTSLNEIGVLSGVSGIALFHFNYSRLKNCKENYNLGVELIEYCITKINKGYSFPTYCAGIAGFGWLMEHLIKENFIKIQDNIISELDEYLFKVMTQNIEEQNFDMLHGAIGYGNYFFKRYTATSDMMLKGKYKNYLLFLIKFLEIYGLREGNKIKWLTKIGANDDFGFDLGLSHGISSFISFFSKLNFYEDFNSITEPLLRQSIEYIFSMKLNKLESTSLFPSIQLPNGKMVLNSRLSWCYGDLGIGLALLQASKTLEDQSLKKYALKIFTHACKRKSLEENLVRDASICHGAFGIAIIFLRVYKETGEKKFKNTSEYWLKVGLDLATNKNGYAGYMQFEPNKEQINEWKKYLNLLVGIAGIGLVIIDYLAEFETNWDECLMIS